MDRSTHHRDDRSFVSLCVSTHSAWTGLLYLIPPKEETGEQNSFIISLGAKSAVSHEQALSLLCEHLKDLSENVHWFYDAEFGKRIPVMLKVFNRLEDLPERSAVTGTAQYNGVVSLMYRNRMLFNNSQFEISHRVRPASCDD